MSIGWGAGLWGSCSWGIGYDPPVSLEVSDVVVWAADTLEIIFNVPACNDDALQLASSYTITPVSAGTSVEVRSVRTGKDPTSASAFLIVTPPTVAAQYQVSLNAGLTTADGGSVETSTSTKFYARLTKVDTQLSTRPYLYDLRPEAIFRNIMNAIGRSDDKIGGNQNENI